MSNDSGRLSFSPFPPEYRACGVLLHVASLPSPYGTGDVGPTALAWVDRLHEAGQSWWQALPLGPTVYGNSPYQAMSSFAGNELLISPDGLIEDGLLRASDCKGNSFSACSGGFIGSSTHSVQTATRMNAACCPRRHWDHRR
jgi:4-alpha-glucanotransferase